MKDLGCFVYMYIRNFAFSLQVYWESFFSYMLAPDHILLLTLKTLMKLCIHIQLEKQYYIQEVLLYSSVEESAPRVFRSCRNSTCSSVCFALYNTQRTSTVFYKIHMVEIETSKERYDREKNILVSKVSYYGPYI